MRFGYVLLGLVALTSVHTSSGLCSNGIADGDICCDAGCGTCGGGGCARRPGGASNCCTSRIRDSGTVCTDTQDAPCIIEDQSMCDNGLRGVQSGDICCDASCGTCGGSGCARRPGGSSSCCSSRIRDSGMMCGTTLAAPCIVNDVTEAPTSAPTASPTYAPTANPTYGPTYAPTAMPTATPTEAPVQACSNGILGFQSGDICCAPECGTCGGRGCGSLTGGGASCCAGPISRNGMMCSIAMQAPCIIDPLDVTEAPTSAPTASPTYAPTANPTYGPTYAPTAMPTATPTEAPVQACSNGILGFQSGDICCAPECGTCGGRGCGSLTGGGASCCAGPISRNGMMCSIAMQAPCIIDPLGPV